MRCPEPRSEHSDVNMTLTGRGVKDNTTYSCPRGYWYTGSFRRVCQRNGQWSGIEGKCEGSAEIHVNI